MQAVKARSSGKGQLTDRDLVRAGNVDDWRGTVSCGHSVVICVKVERTPSFDIRLVGMMIDVASVAAKFDAVDSFRLIDFEPVALTRERQRSSSSSTLWSSLTTGFASAMWLLRAMSGSISTTGGPTGGHSAATHARQAPQTLSTDASPLSAGGSCEKLSPPYTPRSSLQATGSSIARLYALEVISLYPTMHARVQPTHSRLLVAATERSPSPCTG